MTKIAYNSTYGGFGLSDKAFKMLLDRKGIKWEVRKGMYGRNEIYKVGDGPDANPLWDHRFTENRTDPDLVAVIEELGEAANDGYSSLAIAEVPSGVRYRIDEYDGSESVMTIDDYDWLTA